MAELEKETMDEMVAQGWERTADRTRRKWIYAYRHCEYFEVTYLAENDMARLPPFLLAYPNEKEDIRRFMRANLADLSCEKVQDYIQNTIFKKLFAEQDEKKSLEDFLGQYGIKFLSLSTVLRWMHCLGCKYDSRRKSFYVDTHEAEETKIYRKKSGKNYLELEARMHRYVQLTSSQVDKYVEKHGLIRGGGCCYFDIAKQQNMYEYHVDACDAFLEDLTSHMEFGGNLSFKFGKSKLTVEENSRHTKN